MRNIEHQKHLTESLLHDIVLQSPAGIMVVSNNPQEIIYANTEALKLGHPHPLFCIGQPLNDCWHSCRFFFPDGRSCPPEQLPLMQALVHGESLRGQPLLVQWDNGNQQWLQTAATPLFEQGEVVAAVWIFSDISDIMFQQRQLYELNSIKQRLLRVLSHDLRGAFNGLLFFSEALSESISNNDNTMFGEYAEMIKHSAQCAFDMASDMLGWALQNEGSAGAVYERVALQQLTDTVIEELRFSAHVKRIQFRVTVARDLFVYCDRIMIGSVLRNLLGNAVKFSYTGEMVDVYAEEDCQQVKVTVKDYGTGMNPEEAKEFNTSHTLNCKPGTNGEQGSGLGLLICKDFIARHQGQLQVHCSAGTGCSFVFSLPKKRQNE